MEYGMCEECKQKNIRDFWCNTCNAKRFQQNFKNWTSGNDDVDKFIQQTQLSAKEHYKVLEWIPYDRFYNIEYIAKGGFVKVYKAIWIDGLIEYWDNKNKNWTREFPDMDVALKSLNNSKNVTLEFINEITSHHKILDYNGLSWNSSIIRLYGITQDPSTKNYMMIADGLNNIHANELIHQDLHIGNILHNRIALITDMGLCKPADYNPLENTKKSVYGVLPYIAPEILRGQNYTKAADIYTLKICQGFRPRFDIKVPQLIVHLIKRCLDANQLNRPTAIEIRNILYQWINELKEMEKTELKKQIEEADTINNKSQTCNVTLTSLSYETHSEAIYTSRLLNFNNLPEPKNSDDYYNQYDNIISAEYSENLQIDISQLKINDDDLLVNIEFILVVPAEALLDNDKSSDETIAEVFFYKLFGQSPVTIRIFTALIVLSVISTVVTEIWSGLRVIVVAAETNFFLKYSKKLRTWNAWNDSYNTPVIRHKNNLKNDKNDKELNKKSDRSSKIEYEVSLFFVIRSFILTGLFILIFSFIVHVECPNYNPNCNDEYLREKRIE
ncbi:kinase-like domain-containing protein [Glomus cerebriforme]|uniref:Kinase-like domain-containing protein n=1 Tax=Glomus cerebriforme TaxID=658196 RepID=A0A397SVX6_9GLOM|nr:kinase-like domain-containing protein [Glomus cerebriforme]